ncbi:MAG TPA: histidine kinase [Candidatus Dormibacteraeota bacterium]
MATALSRHAEQQRSVLRKYTGWIVLGIVVLTVVLFGAGSGLMDAASRSPSLPENLRLGAGSWFFRLTPVYGQAFSVVGALIIWRRPGNRVGIVAMAVGFLWALYLFAIGYDAYSEALRHGTLALTGVVAFLVGWEWAVPTVLMLFYLPFLFPDGNPPSPRWLPVQRWLLAAVLSGAVGALVIPAATAVPAGIVAGFSNFFEAMLVVCALLAPASLVARYRHTTLEVRQQVKWFALAYVALALVAVLGFFVNLITIHSAALSFTPIFEILIPIAMIGVAITVGLAVFKYHLYDIDVIIRRTLVYGALVVLIGLLYLVLVVTIGTRIGPSPQGDPAIPFVVAAVVALAFQPVRVRLTRYANRLVYGKRATPYEVLSHFSASVDTVYSQGELTERMAHLLADGTGADRAEVWLRVGDELRPATAWPAAATAGRAAPLALSGQDAPPVPGAADAAAVTHQGELLGVLAVHKREPVSGTEHRLLTDLARQAAVVLRNERLTAELEDRLQELQASRQRLVGAQDEERRRLERDLHDGAQQNLVALKIQLGLAKTLAAKSPESVEAMLDKLTADADEAIQVLRRFSHGIYPPILAEKGLTAALEAHARLLPVAVEVAPASPLPRLQRQSESAVYFCVLEALQNVVKHAEATRVCVELAAQNGRLRFAVVDDGHGFDPSQARGGAGMQNMADRLAALGGELEVSREPNGGARVGGWVPAVAPQ